MFNEEIVVKYKETKIAWYPIEKLCIVINKKSHRIYKNIPKKYKQLFIKESAKSSTFFYN